MRYIWELESQYFPPERFGGIAGAFVRHTCARLREWDVATADRASALVANSHFVAARIRRHWNRDASVVHPCVAVERFAPAEGPREYYLLAGAFAPYKRLDLALQAFAALKLPLVVAGGGQDDARLRAMAPPHVRFVPITGDRGAVRRPCLPYRRPEGIGITKKGYSTVREGMIPISRWSR